jgi:predicted peptidase
MKNFALIYAFLSTTCIAAMPLTASAGDQILYRLVQKRVQINSYSIPYVIYIPGANPDPKNQPVILYLSGSGERGSDGMLQTTSGIGPSLNSKRFPAVVVMPQCPLNKVWSDAMDPADPSSPRVEDLALKALDEASEIYDSDPDRVYLTGTSLGGFAAWDIASQYPDRFAAVLAIAGGGSPATMAPLLKSVPIWAANGRWDTTVPRKRTREMVAAVRAQGNPNVHYTEYFFDMHNCWDDAYRDETILKWLFEQRRK